MSTYVGNNFGRWNFKVYFRQEADEESGENTIYHKGPWDGKAYMNEMRLFKVK